MPPSLHSGGQWETRAGHFALLLFPMFLVRFDQKIDAGAVLVGKC